MPFRKSYACYTVYTRPGQRHVLTLAPPGSTFDFAWEMFRRFFRKRVGADWENRERLKRTSNDADGEEGKIGGEDGANDGLFDFFGPAILNQGREGDKSLDSAEPRQRKPSVTVLLNAEQSVSDDQLEVQAKTPDGGW